MNTTTKASPTPRPARRRQPGRRPFACGQGHRDCLPHVSQRSFADAPAVTIVVKRDDRAWGHTSVAKLWAANGSTEAADRFEIMISGENLRRGAEAVAATLLHEAAHAAQPEQGHSRHGFQRAPQQDIQGDGRRAWPELRVRPLARLDEDGANGRGPHSLGQADQDHRHGPAQGCRLRLCRPLTTCRGLKALRRPAVTFRPGKTGVAVAPPKRGNRNLLKATWWAAGTRSG